MFIDNLRFAEQFALEFRTSAYVFQMVVIDGSA